MLMYEHRHPTKRVDVVDLDPYGTAAPFIDGAVQAVADGGTHLRLAVMHITDIQVSSLSLARIWLFWLARSTPRNGEHHSPGDSRLIDSYSNYGGVSVNTSWSHEAALRLVLGSLSSAAARYGRYITPLVSFSIDFYVRLFVRVDTRAQEVKKLARYVRSRPQAGQHADFSVKWGWCTAATFATPIIHNRSGVSSRRRRITANLSLRTRRLPDQR